MLQDAALSAVFSLLNADDVRVRETIANTLVQLTARLFFPEDWPGIEEFAIFNFHPPTPVIFSFAGQDALIAVVERKAAFLTGQSSAVNWCSGSKAEDLNEQHLHVPRFAT